MCYFVLESHLCIKWTIRCKLYATKVSRTKITPSLGHWMSRLPALLQYEANFVEGQVNKMPNSVVLLPLKMVCDILPPGLCLWSWRRHQQPCNFLRVLSSHSWGSFHGTKPNKGSGSACRESKGTFIWTHNTLALLSPPSTLLSLFPWSRDV